MILICDTLVPFEFRNIFLKKLTGELSVSTLKNKKKMFFSDGRLIHSESDFFDEQLGIILNLTGKVSDSQYDNISGLIHSADDQVGNILVQNGIISKDDLKEAVLYRMKRIAVSSFSIVSGELSFKEGVSPENSVSGLRIPVEELIYSGGRRIESVNCISKKYYFNSPEVLKGKEKLYNILSIEERELIEVVNNSEGLSNPRLISRSGISPDSYWEMIAVLFLLGIVEFSPDVKDKPTEEDIIGLVRLKNSLENGDSDMFSILGVTGEESSTGIQKAYISLTQKYDPERFGADISPEIRKSAQYVVDKLGTVFGEINETRTGKKENEHVSDENISEDPAEPVKQSILSDEDSKGAYDFDEYFDKFEKGKDLYMSNKFDEALIHLKGASKIGEPKYENLLYLGMCQIHLPFFSDESERNLKKAIEMAPAKSEPVHALGKLYLKLNKKKNAKKCFERAVGLEPGNIDAAQDLFRLKYPPKKKKKLFSR
ncbi:MAG: DUF4388 domain-containing protein [Acidobacteriota bacterium]